MDPCHILLVDDEIDLAQSLGRALEQEGYRVTLAYDGLAASQWLSQPDPHQPDGDFDLLILDWMLPHLSGLELCQTLRARQDPRPILFLTAKDTLDDRVDGLDAGADDYLVKPFELRELLARVRALLRRPAQVSTMEDATSRRWREPSAPRLRVGDLDLDLGSQVVYRQQQAIQLSEKETQLLALLMDYPGQLLSHAQIYEQLWPQQQDRPSSNVLAAQIRLLRRKIETSPDHLPRIQTVYRKGYRLEA
jgi:OmpR-family two-component system manganese-sensing response regulator